MNYQILHKLLVEDNENLSINAAELEDLVKSLVTNPEAKEGFEIMLARETRLERKSK